MKIGRFASCFALNFSFLTYLAVVPCFGQVAKMFVKVEPHQCWLDVQDSVYRRANGIITDETSHILTINRFASIEGTIAIVVQVQSDQNKKGEAGCSILVGETGNSAPHGSDQRMNAFYGGGNFRAAAQIATDVNMAQKARDKKAKSASP